MTQLYLSPDYQPKVEEPKPKVNYLPAFMVALFILGSLLAIASWSIDYDKSRVRPCELWSSKDKNGEQVCIKWRGREKVMR